MIEHYIGYLQIWFIGYFREYSRLDGAYQIFQPVMGKTLSMDDGLNFLAVTFIPWITHIYVFLAAGNLARRDKNDFAKVYKSKMLFLFWLFIAFTIEQFLLARNISEFFYIGPTQLWCILLGLLATLYRFIGVKAIWVLGVISVATFDINVPLLDFMKTLESNLKVNVYLDAHFQVFLPTVCLGFAFGYLYFSKAPLTRHRVIARRAIFTLSLVSPILWKLSGGHYTVPLNNIFASEHALSTTWLGRFAVLGFIYCISVLALAFDKRFHNPNWPLLGWAGREILAIYLIHKLFFVFIYMPLRNFLAIHINILPSVSVFEILSAVICGLIFIRIIQRGGLTKMLDRGV